VSSAPVRDAEGEIIGSVSVVRDVTDRKSSDDELRRTKDYLESLFDYANAPIIVWDPSSNITRFNHAFEHMTGYSAAEVIGKNLSILFPQETKEDSLANINQTLAGTYWESVEIPILRKDGGIRIALWNSANIHAEDGKTIIATIAQGQDITERKEGEARLKEYSEDLARSNAELQSFAYVASHDLREPLRTIASFLEILKMDYGDKLDAQARDHIERTVRASKRLHDMIDDLLSYSRLETRKKPFTKVDLKDVLVLAERDLSATITEHGAKVSAESLPVVSADDQQMLILFRNLIDNAVKFHGPEPPKVRIEAKRRNDEWLISVKDNGIGVDPANYNKIFDMFVRLHSWKDYPGNGIGLSMCKKIVERHGGRIWVESESGKGTTFFFTLPDHDLSSSVYDWRGEADPDSASGAPKTARQKTRKVKEGAMPPGSSGPVRSS
jgi:PAS domain S-box-containing protein